MAGFLFDSQSQLKELSKLKRVGFNFIFLLYCFSSPYTIEYFYQLTMIRSQPHASFRKKSRKFEEF
ncbi:hypothetical protein A1704_07915 [Chryseobacterium cucumeris]|nr:hypothetical protein A1704_07915 [Chryseobacterium cucumeris]